MLKEVEGDRSFPIIIGIFEVTALDRTLKGMVSPRPLTHDALVGTIKALDGQLQEVRFTRLDNQIYFVEARIRQGDRQAVVDMRPSDAILLALKCGVPVLIPRQLFDEVTRIDGG